MGQSADESVVSAAAGPDPTVGNSSPISEVAANGLADSLDLPCRSREGIDGCVAVVYITKWF